jgi:hypothetical protein
MEECYGEDDFDEEELANFLLFVLNDGSLQSRKFSLICDQLRDSDDRLVFGGKKTRQRRLAQTKRNIIKQNFKRGTPIPRVPHLFLKEHPYLLHPITSPATPRIDRFSSLISPRKLILSSPGNLISPPFISPPEMTSSTAIPKKFDRKPAATINLSFNCWENAFGLILLDAYGVRAKNIEGDKILVRKLRLLFPNFATVQDFKDNTIEFQLLRPTGDGIRSLWPTLPGFLMGDGDGSKKKNAEATAFFTMMDSSANVDYNEQLRDDYVAQAVQCQPDSSGETTFDKVAVDFKFPTGITCHNEVFNGNPDNKYELEVRFASRGTVMKSGNGKTIKLLHPMVFVDMAVDDESSLARKLQTNKKKKASNPNQLDNWIDFAEALDSVAAADGKDDDDGDDDSDDDDEEETTSNMRN